MKEVAVDIETTGLDFRTDSIVCVTVKGGPGCATSATIIYYPDNFDYLAHVLDNRDICKVFHNAAFDIPFLIKAGLRVRNFYCTMVGEQLITNGEPDKSKGLLATLERYGFETHSKELQTSFKVGQKLTPEQIAYCKADVAHLSEIKAMQHEKLPAALIDLEMRTTEVLISMHMTGLRVKRKEFQEHADRLKRTYEAECNELQETILIDWRNPNAVKKYFAVSSMEELVDGLEAPVQTQTTMFDKPGDSGICLSHWLKVRKENYLPGVNNFFEKGGHSDGDAWRFHIGFQQNLVSGRIATRSPNIQGLDGDFKKYIVPTPGMKLVIADFGGQELGIAAHLSQDPVMLRTILDGYDLHSVTAEKLWPKQWEKVKESGCAFPFRCKCKDHKNIRDKAKTIMFGLMYGLGKSGLCKRLGVTENEAGKILNDFYRTYPRLVDHLQRWSLEPGRNKGWGYSPKYERPRFYGRHGEQGARNSPIQTTGAEMLKLSMIRLHEAAPTMYSRLLLPVHDEILTESERPEVWMPAMEVIMNDCADELTEPGLIYVEIKTSETWK